MSREEEVRANLDGVRQRIVSACVAAGRAPESVTLIVVTKNFPASDVRIARRTGSQGCR